MDELVDMVRVCKEEEGKLGIDPQHLNQHGEDVSPGDGLSAAVRWWAVDWMVDVQQQCDLKQETLFLGVALMDRFLSVAEGLPRRCLQLLSVCALFLASKQEENPHPSAMEFVHISANKFSRQTLLRFEQMMWGALGMRVHGPTTYTFLCFCKLLLGKRLAPRAMALATYLSELVLLHYSMLQYQPSVQAASAMLLALCYENLLHLAAEVLELMGMSIDSVLPCMHSILLLQQQAWLNVDEMGCAAAVNRKFSSDLWYSASSTVQPFQALPVAHIVSQVHGWSERMDDDGGPAAVGAPDTMDSPAGATAVGFSFGGMEACIGTQHGKQLQASLSRSNLAC